jgi:hypothetical protein
MPGPIDDSAYAVIDPFLSDSVTPIRVTLAITLRRRTALDRGRGPSCSGRAAVVQLS